MKAYKTIKPMPGIPQGTDILDRRQSGTPLMIFLNEKGLSQEREIHIRLMCEFFMEHHLDEYFQELTK